MAGSLVEKVHASINGVKQGMFIRSRDAAHPVLLYLHGGPGMPTYFLNRKYPTGLEEDFTAVWWEQRGAGLSYNPKMPPESMTVQQFIADTLAVTDYLRSRLGKEKIYLMGHSWGSFVGIQAAARAPERYCAYIGVAQMANQLQSETLAYEHMLKLAKENGNTRLVRKLEAAPPTATAPLPGAYMALRDEAMHSLGVGTTHDMQSVVTGVFLPTWQNPEYSLREKINIWRGKWSPYSKEFVERDAGNGHQGCRAGTADSHLLPARRIRLHRRLSANKSLFWAVQGAREGVLYVRTLGAQPHF